MSKSEKPTKDEDEIKNENSDDQGLTIKKPVRFQELDLSRLLANIKVPDYSEIFKSIKVPDYSEMLKSIKVPDYSEIFKSIKVLDYSEMLKSIKVLDYSEIFKSIKVPDYSEIFKSIKVLDYSEMLESIKVPDYSEIFKSIKVLDYSEMLESIKVLDYFEMLESIKVPDYSEMLESIKVPDYSEMLESIKVPDYSEMLANIQSLDGIRLVFENWAKTNVQVFDIINKRISFIDRIDSRILPVLKKYNWFITVSLETDFILNLSHIIGNHPDKLAKVIRQEYINYFSNNNYQKLTSMIRSWERNPLFKPRMKIFRDSYNLVKHSNNSYNPSNLLIPTLISQIDGILTDYLIQNQFNVVKEGKGLVWKDKLNNIICKVSYRNKIYTKIFDPDFPEYSLTNDSISKVALENGNDFILNTLFQTAYTKQKLKKPFGLNRHKIMHGEYTKYGRTDHLIRLFLILDFLYGLKDVDYNEME